LRAIETEISAAQWALVAPEGLWFFGTGLAFCHSKNVFFFWDSEKKTNVNVNKNALITYIPVLLSAYVVKHE